MAPFPNFIGPAYRGSTAVLGVDVCENLYLQRNESPGAATPWALLRRPGLVQRALAVEGPGRGLFAQNGRAFGLLGFKLKELFADWTLTDRGSVALDSTPSTISSSGDAGAELLITSAGSVYVYNLLTDVLSAAIGGIRLHQSGYLANRFLGLDRTTSTFWVSALLDGTTWTLFAQRALAPDTWQAIFVADAYVVLFGSETSEFWFADPSAYPFPFSPVPGVLMQYGIAAPDSVAGVDKQPVWLSKSAAGQGMVHRGQGTGEPVRISTHALETEFASYSTIADAQGSSLQWNGHSIYLLTFPTALKTWMYDYTASQQAGFPCWYEWPTLRNGVQEAWRALGHCFAFGKHVVADRATGAIYELSDSVYTDNGAPIRWVRRAPFITNSPLNNFYDSLTVLAQVATGLQSGQGSDPQIAFRMSRDGGYTYGNERLTTVGAVGKYLTRIVFSMLGKARGNPVFEISGSDPVPVAMVGADVGVTPGTN